MATKAKAKPASKKAGTKATAKAVTKRTPKVAAPVADKPARKAATPKAAKVAKAGARAKTETRGRKPLPEDQRTIGRSVRMPQPLWDKAEKMGGAAKVIRHLVEKASVRNDRIPAGA